eukprot:COSAG01_NODE_73985_length_231_cov_7.727273_1_plen_53_part_01
MIVSDGDRRRPKRALHRIIRLKEFATHETREHTWHVGVLEARAGALEHERTVR